MFILSYNIMTTLPESIYNHIIRFNSHPVADLMKESSIFKFLHHLNGELDDAFKCGRRDGYNDRAYATYNGTEEQLFLYPLAFKHHYDQYIRHPRLLVETPYHIKPQLTPADDNYFYDEDIDSESDCDTEYETRYYDKPLYPVCPVFEMRSYDKVLQDYLLKNTM